MKVGWCNSYQAWYPLIWKGRQSSREVMLEAHTGIQWDPVLWGCELIRWALHQDAIIPELVQRMLGNHLRRLRFRRRRSKSKVAGTFDLTL